MTGHRGICPLQEAEIVFSVISLTDNGPDSLLPPFLYTSIGPDNNIPVHHHIKGKSWAYLKRWLNIEHLTNNLLTCLVDTLSCIFSKPVGNVVSIIIILVPWCSC